MPSSTSRRATGRGTRRLQDKLVCGLSPPKRAALRLPRRPWRRPRSWALCRSRRPWPWSGRLECGTRSPRASGATRQPAAMRRSPRRSPTSASSRAPFRWPRCWRLVRGRTSTSSRRPRARSLRRGLRRAGGSLFWRLGPRASTSGPTPTTCCWTRWASRAATAGARAAATGTTAAPSGTMPCPRLASPRRCCCPSVAVWARPSATTTATTTA
mmetsp:Transcript_69643/g.184887  ORF Transcript_69643/g.184887 Transcript_69643/m.184887 type:complete len:213 (-) Transcript_69643:812-1450(-)